MTHPDIVDRPEARRLLCPTPGCEEPLRRTARLHVRRDDELRFIWRCPRCLKVTELAVDMSDSCWTSDGKLMTTIPTAYSATSAVARLKNLHLAKPPGR